MAAWWRRSLRYARRAFLGASFLIAGAVLSTPAAAATVPPVSLPPVSLPLLSLPPLPLVLVPPVSVPSVSVPPASVPPVAVPPVSPPIVAPSPMTLPSALIPLPSGSTLANRPTPTPQPAARRHLAPTRPAWARTRQIAYGAGGAGAGPLGAPSAVAIAHAPGSVGLRRAVSRELRDQSAPLVVGLLVGAFLLIQARADRRHPRLTEPSVRGDDTIGFA